MGIYLIAECFIMKRWFGGYFSLAAEVGGEGTAATGFANRGFIHASDFATLKWYNSMCGRVI